MKITSSKPLIDVETLTPWKEITLQVPIEKLMDAKGQMLHTEYVMFVGNMFLEEWQRYNSEKVPNEVTKRAMDEAVRIINDSNERFKDID